MLQDGLGVLQTAQHIAFSLTIDRRGLFLCKHSVISFLIGDILVILLSCNLFITYTAFNNVMVKSWISNNIQIKINDVHLGHHIVSFRRVNFLFWGYEGAAGEARLPSR